MEAILVNNMLLKYIIPDVSLLTIEYLYKNYVIVSEETVTCKNCEDNLEYRINLHCDRCEHHFCERCCFIDMGYMPGAECPLCENVLY
jgi:hypothetical protein